MLLTVTKVCAIDVGHEPVLANYPSLRWHGDISGNSAQFGPPDRHVTMMTLIFFLISVIVLSIVYMFIVTDNVWIAGLIQNTQMNSLLFLY